MNGTTLRFAGTAACVLALAAPSAALAAKKHHRTVKKSVVTQTVVVPHQYDAGGDGAGALQITSTTKVNLLDPVELATSLGSQALGQLGLPPLPLP